MTGAGGPGGIGLRVPRGSREQAGPRGPELGLAGVGTHGHAASWPRRLVLSQVTRTETHAQGRVPSQGWRLGAERPLVPVTDP